MSKLQNNDFSPESWLGPVEGQLSVDVIETPTDVIIRSAIAGVKAKDLSIDVTKDTLTVRGERSVSFSEQQATYHLEECYWGTFSRTIVLPQDIKTDQVEAILKDGILTIHLKKAQIHTQPTIIEL